MKRESLHKMHGVYILRVFKFLNDEFGNHSRNLSAKILAPELTQATCIHKFFSINSFRTAICENLDPRNISAIWYSSHSPECPG